MKLRWSNIVFGFYCLGCLIILLFVRMGYDPLILALIYVGFTFMCFTLIAVVAWLKKARAKGSSKVVLSCQTCDECIPLIPENQAPEYKEFVDVHGNHLLKYLLIILGPWRRKGLPVYEPIKNEILIAIGQEGLLKGGLFLIRRARTSIYAPLKYEIASFWHRKIFSLWLRWALDRD